MDRRGFLRTAGGAIAGLALFGLSKSKNRWTSGSPELNFKPPSTNLSLYERAATKGLVYGAALKTRHLRDAKFLASFVTECGALVPEFELKWSALRPCPESFDFTNADKLLAFAKRHGLIMHGHTLLWHRSLPAWFHETVTRANAERILIDHIETVVGRYAGLIPSWDVVNEPVYPGDGRSDGLRTAPWLELLGREYIETAFHVANSTDPRAQLVLNDTRVNYTTRDQEKRRRSLLKLLEWLIGRGVPVHVLGVQAHLWADEKRFDVAVLQRFLQEVADMGLDIYISELDVSDQRLPPAIDVRDSAVARVYYDYVSAVLAVPAVKRVMTWGLSDRYTWFAESRPRSDGLDVRPLPLNANLERKPAWAALAAAFDAASPR